MKIYGCLVARRLSQHVHVMTRRGTQAESLSARIDGFGGEGVLGRQSQSELCALDFHISFEKVNIVGEICFIA
jgi:hypothetical protein